MRKRTNRLVSTLIGTTLVWFVSVVGTTASAATILYNFEELSTGTFTTITSTQGGITATIARQDAGSLSIQDLTIFGSPPSFMHRSIGNFLGVAALPAATLIINFSQAVSGASLAFGDYDGDDDSPVILTGFTGLSGTGSTIGSATVSYPITLNIANGDSDVRTLAVNGTGIQSLTLTSAGPFPGTLFYDNLTATTGVAVPEPSSLILAGCSAVIGLALARARRWLR